MGKPNDQKTSRSTLGDFPGCGAIRRSFRDSDHYPYIQPPSHVLVPCRSSFQTAFPSRFHSLAHSSTALLSGLSSTSYNHKYTQAPESVHDSSCKSSATSTPYKSRQSPSQGPKPLTTHKHYLYDIPESHNSKERDNPTVLYGGQRRSRMWPVRGTFL